MDKLNPKINILNCNNSLHQILSCDNFLPRHNDTATNFILNEMAALQEIGFEFKSYCMQQNIVYPNIMQLKLINFLCDFKAKESYTKNQWNPKKKIVWDPSYMKNFENDSKIKLKNVLQFKTKNNAKTAIEPATKKNKVEQNS